MCVDTAMCRGTCPECAEDAIRLKRDRLAVLCGYEPFYSAIVGGGTWTKPDDHAEIVSHPFPHRDLNPLSDAWPPGWVWGREEGLWWADREPWHPRNPSVFQDDTGDEYGDRLNLLVAVLEADKVC